MDQEGASEDEQSKPTQVDPRDGLINFAGYTFEQLRELQTGIDQRAFPQNYKHLLDALELKEREVAEPRASGPGHAGRFSSRAGFLGWLRAKTKRSPVFGVGAIEVRSTDVLLRGWQRTWLGVPIEAEITRELSQLRNVVEEQGAIRFEVKRPYRLIERIQFQPDSAEGARQLIEELPRVETKGFQARWSAVREFNERLISVSGRPWITPVIVALNIVVFVAMTVASKKIGQFTIPELLSWGANFGPLTVNGQWWRLFTALFVHFNVLHLLLNMWALWNIGCLTERLFGRRTYLFLYVCAGALASLASIAWDPSLASVGASGAIFGVFGAFLGFLRQQRRQIPSWILRKHWISTLAFVLFNLASGALQPGIDNAAHVGGLLCGFALGLILARPLDIEVRQRFVARTAGSAGALVLILCILAIWQIKGIGSELTISEQYFHEHSAYLSGEAKNLQLWNELAVRASRGSISDAEMSQSFERDILPFWQSQKVLLDKENETAIGPKRNLALLVAQFVDLREKWAEAVIDATQNSDASRAADAVKYMKETTLVQARLERIGIRSRMDHRPRSLAATPLVIKVRQFLSGGAAQCVTAPAGIDAPLADSDDKNDGPAMRRELGCRAQRLFLTGDYRQLESLMNQYMVQLEDLPDGSSRYEAIVSGLTNLFRFGGVDALSAFGRTSDWRRAVKGSVMADLTEAILICEWAYGARGMGFANSVSSQNMAIFSYRSEMAAAALAEMADRAADNPHWYALSLDVGLDQSKDKNELRKIFDQGFERSPNYRPLFGHMLRILMPRWSGSYGEVDEFINAIQEKTAASRGYERYAQLYSVYARAEGDELKLFADTPAFWSGMRSGYLGLIKRYPASDFVLNSFANFACRAGDPVEYGRLREAVGKRLSSTAWSSKYSLADCDKQLASGGEFRAQLAPELSPDGRLRSLAHIRLGMTRSELLTAKGQPINKEANSWVFNSIDSKHNGVLTAIFSRPADNAEGTVIAIEYVGDEASAPVELPYLNDMNSVNVLQMYGPQLSGNLSLHADVTFTFKNGIYVNTREAKVYRYGIFAVP
jgi:membrane associated rhomboid family serine protease